MNKADQHRATARALLETRGTTFSEEIGIGVEKNTPAPLFQLLCEALLFSARISAAKATGAMRGLIDAGLTTPRKMAEASWQQRVDAITGSYKRYDERTATMLGDTAERLLERYGGDLRELREEAGRDLEREHQLLEQFKGVGPVGADIFLREVQGTWSEAYPYADDKVRKAARELDLPADPEKLAELTSRKKFPALVAALVRTDLENAYDEVREAAAG